MSKRDERAAAAAKIAEEARRRERRGVIVKVAAVVVAMIVIVGVAVAVGLNRGDSGGSSSVDTSAATSADSRYSLEVGDKNAPHTIVVYEDFLCPYCDQLELASRDQLSQLAAAGKVRLIYRPFRLLSPDYSAQALNAFAVVLQKSGPEVAKKFHDLLYENQPSEEGPFPKVSSLVDLAVKAGADRSAVEADILDTSSQQAWVDGATKAAAAAGVQSTPTILLDGKPFEDGNTLQEIAANLVKAVS